MTRQTNEISDSFYDDNDDSTPSPSFISKIEIVTSKPPICPQQNQSLNSSYSSEHDITDVSSINEQHQRQPFQLQSMKHVLLGSLTPTSPPPSPVYSYQQDIKKKDLRKTHQQPYIHNHQRIRITSSAINRQKQQQKIERENLKILERLQHIRPTRSLKREELLSNYNRHMGIDTYPIEFSRPSSAANISSSFSISDKNSRIQSRPSSATYSLHSHTLRTRSASASSHRPSSSSSSSRKPIWNDRWQQQE